MKIEEGLRRCAFVIFLKTTPAVEAVLTDHEWTLTESLGELATLG